MGPSYAGILGTIAFATLVFRNAIHGVEVGPTIISACILLFVFAVIGYVIGRVAASIVTESVRVQMNRELEAFNRSAEQSG